MDSVSLKLLPLAINRDKAKILFVLKKYTGNEKRAIMNGLHDRLQVVDNESFMWFYDTMFIPFIIRMRT